LTLEFRDLEWALVASQQRSLRQAAERLNIRQSTLSRRLRNLEYLLGASLFERSTGGTRLTAAGELFIRSAQRLVDDANTTLTTLRTFGRGGNGMLKVGVQTSLATGNLRATIIEHQKRFPGVRIHAVDGSAQQLLFHLDSEAIDIAIGLEDGLRWNGHFQALWSERVVIAVAADHHFAAQDVVHWPQLAGERILIPAHGPGSDFQRLLLARLGYFAGDRILYQDVGLDRLLTFVGARIGLLIALEGATGARYPDVVYRELREGEGATRVNFRACWKKENANPALIQFLAIIRERFPDLSSS